MIKVPYDIVRDKIKSLAKMTDDQLDDRIKGKIDKLSGLISKEGAAHIIANEIGINLFEQTSGRLKINNILAGMRNVEIVGRVQQVFEVREFQTETRSGKVGSFIIGDETGTIRVVLWGTQADKLSELEKDKIIKIQAGYVKDNRGRKELHLGEQGVIDLNPEGEEVGEVKRVTSTRHSIKDLAENMADAEILGTVVQAYDMKFFEVCPQCGKKIITKENGAICTEHGTVVPAYSYVFNLVVDDGTGNIRVAFFRKQVERLLGKADTEIVGFKDAPDKFEKVKYDLLGKQIKVVGRVNKNMMFDRMEFVAQLVFPDPDPAEEIKRLETEKKDAPPVPQYNPKMVKINQEPPQAPDKKPLFSVTENGEVGKNTQAQEQTETALPSYKDLV